MRTHKYVKRSGSKGNYKYWYKLPDGRIVAQDDMQDKGKLEHVKRLIAGRGAGHHEMSNGDIAAHVGVPNAKVSATSNNMNRANRYSGQDGAQWRGRAFQGHDFSEAHMKEAKHEDVSHPDYERHVAGATTEARRESSAARTETARAAAAPAKHETNEHARSAGFTQKPDHLHRHVTHGAHTIQKQPDGKFELIAQHGHLGTETTKHATLKQAAAHSKTTEQKHDAEMAKRHRAEAASHQERSQALQSVAREAGASNAAPTSQSLEKKPGESTEDYQKRLMEHLAAHGGPDFRAKPASASWRPGQPKPPPDRPEPRAPRASRRASAPRATTGRAAGDIPETDEPTPAQTARRARAEANVRRQQVSASSPSSNALGAADPEFARSEAPIRRMEEVEASGGNPYVERAKEIYHNIVGDLKPERAAVARHMFSAIDKLKESGQPMNEANLLAAYKSETGSTRIRTLPHDEFEKATFMSLQEVMENKPVDAEVERMKRGYAAKQFARMKPFIKDAWHAAHPSAPPPFPTFGDVKSWGEHGPKPAWAGQTRLALPREVHEAAHKGADGKPKYPPAWMPIHMMPTWNYVMKKSGDDSPYQTRNVNIQSGRLNLGNQAAYQEGFVIAALRKYVQMRGGADQLTDIPKHKLSEVGLTHSDIFKSKELSDDQLKQLTLHKIIDPVALVPLLDHEVQVHHHMEKSTKHTFSLVVDSETKAFDFKKSFIVKEQEVKKALIAKIKKLRSEKGL
jgi:hypothetical protein